MFVFLSYGAAEDQYTALRLQALGAVNGLSVYVPPVHTRKSPGAGLDRHSLLQLREADVVLAVVRFGISDTCVFELNTGLQRGVPTIAMAEQPEAGRLSQTPGLKVVVIDPTSPSEAEVQIVNYLRAVNAEQNTKTALVALGTVALGLLLFAPQES
jgi:hypothetical protein